METRSANACPGVRTGAACVPGLESPPDGETNTALPGTPRPARTNVAVNFSPAASGVAATHGFCPAPPAHVPVDQLLNR